MIRAAPLRPSRVSRSASRTVDIGRGFAWQCLSSASSFLLSLFSDEPADRSPCGDLSSRLEQGHPLHRSPSPAHLRREADPRSESDPSPRPPSPSEGRALRLVKLPKRAQEAGTLHSPCGGVAVRRAASEPIVLQPLWALVRLRQCACATGLGPNAATSHFLQQGLGRCRMECASRQTRCHVEYLN
jgi:hypothetical protein